MKYNRSDFLGKSFVAIDYYGAYAYQTIIFFSDSTYNFSSRRGVIQGYGTWNISDDKKMLFLKGKEFKSIYPQSKVDQNLSFSIKNKNMINNGKTKYKCIKD